MVVLAIRFALWVILTACVAQVIQLEATTLSAERMFSEWGYVETLQSLVLFSTICLLLLKRHRDVEVRALASLMALAFAILLVRENDQVLELWLPHGIWKYPAALLAAWLGWLAWRGRDQWPAQLRRFATTPAFGMLTTGFLCLGFSRLLGRGSMWQAVMGDAYLRQVKNAVEEGVELFALSLMMMAIIEWLLPRRD